MNLLRNWKIILSLVAIFAAGTITGSVLTLRAVKRMNAPEQWSKTTLRDLSRKLNLTPEQVSQIQPLVEKRSQELKAIRTEAFRDVFMVILGLDKEIEQLLTPEQREALSQMRAEFRARWRERLKERLPES